MDHSNHSGHSCCTHQSSNDSVRQTLSEMDWERGIWNAAFNGEKDRVEELVDKAKNVKEVVNAPDNAGYTALHYAARRGHLHICKVLVQNGADVNAYTKSGKATPLHKAAAAGEIVTAEYLIQSGADVTTQDVDGQTALHKAVDNNNFELVNLLLEKYPQLALIKDIKGRLPVQTTSL